MSLAVFENELAEIATDHEFENFCQQKLLHGTPFIFRNREDDFFAFKKRISKKFGVSHTEVFVVGSGKLGFSPLKKSEFSLDSDVDLAVVSTDLSDKVGDLGLKFEYDLRASQTFLSSSQKDKYHRYLRYKAIGWIRPDLIPQKSPLIGFKDDWFNFFSSISYDRSEVGNYKVSAGLFKSLRHLELYTTDSIRKIQKKLEVKLHND